MAGNVGAWSVEPVVNPSLREAKRQRLIRMTKEQIAGRTGPVRQIRYRDQVVSPLALELECRKLLQRAQRAIATIVKSRVYAGDLRGTVEEPASTWWRALQRTSVPPWKSRAWPSRPPRRRKRSARLGSGPP